MTKYRNSSPYWLKAKYAGQCVSCKAAVRAGDDALYFGRGSGLECAECGRKSDILIQEEKRASDDYCANYGGGW